jgi:glycosyltransferase involved in cell wall biosynthesis
MSSISVVIATKDEQPNIANCLDNLKWADEIVIVDDVSTDKTIEICRQYTKNVFTNDSNGSFHINKNIGIEKANNEWILSLDADEIIEPALAREIMKTIKKSDKIGYYIPRKNYFLGRWINGCGWWPDRIIRLFKKGVTQWPLEIHDTPKIEQKNKVGELKNALIHHTYRNLKHYFEKFNKYTTQLAKEEYEKGVRVNFINFFLLFFIKPLYWFICKYFFNGGFRNAYPGFFISFSSAWVIIATYSKLWEMQKSK